MIRTFLDIQRGHQPALVWFATLTDLPGVPGYVVMELVQGAQNTQQVTNVIKLVRPLPVVWPSESDCDRALADFTAYHLSHRLGLIDALIAACVIGLSAQLCTFNVRHYRMIQGLETIQPYLHG